jgi:hypothetical protein
VSVYKVKILNINKIDCKFNKYFLYLDRKKMIK